jgi:hypothetical protein
VVGLALDGISCAYLFCHGSKNSIMVT